MFDLLRVYLSTWVINEHLLPLYKNINFSSFLLEYLLHMIKEITLAST